MKFYVKRICQIILFLIVSLVIANIWWRMWFYHGWFSSPGWLLTPFGADGEVGYDVILLEMFMICSGIILIAFIGLKTLKKRKRINKSVVDNQPKHINL